MGLILTLLIGIVWRVVGIPVPAPPAIVDALLIVAMTVGFVATDMVLTIG